jgi:hypothetical protein
MHVDKTLFKEAPAGFLGRMRTSLQSVVNHIKLPQLLIEAIYNNNQGQLEYVVSSLMLLCDALHGQHAHTIAAALANTPIAEWDERGTGELESVARQATHLEIKYNAGEPNFPNYKHALVGRLKTITGRDLRQHDVDAEVAQRSYASQPHAYNLDADEQCDCWHHDLYTALRSYCSEAVATAPNMPQDLENWWAARAVWLPHGTSSQKIHEERLLKTILINKAIRNTKAIILGAKDCNYLQQGMLSKPKIVCRAATKNEPGKKRRPLRAADDLSYVIAAFGSSNLEKYLSIRGSVMRQTPDDVRRTAAHVAASAMTNGYILCIDYSDFNNTHTTRSRCLANLAMARAHLASGNTQQARAAYWMAQAHLNHWLGATRSNQGLSSGERDTARDNTMLHNVYSGLVGAQCDRRSNGWRRPKFTQMCGDDEIVGGFRWSDAVQYVMEHARQGHKVNARKIMLSKYCGEFLQYNMIAIGEKVPAQPLPPALNNFVSGSWYKSSNYSVGAYPQQVAEAAASCIRRGAQHDTMTMLCAATCSWLCRGTNWRNALMATNLFGAITTKPTTDKERQNNPASAIIWPAVSDYVRLICSRFNVPTGMIGTIADYAKTNLISSVESDLRLICETAAEGEKDALRLTMPQAVKPKDLTDAVHKWRTAERDVRMDQKTWMAVQLGLPLQLIDKIGIRTAMEMANNRQRQHINKTDEPRVHTLTPQLMAMLPGAIAPYFRIQAGPADRSTQLNKAA